MSPRAAGTPKQDTRADRTASNSGAARPERPGSPAKRLVVVDAVRAAALFGVLVMNLRSMSGLEFLSAAQLEALQDTLDRIIDAVLMILVDKKALSAFSFLFGLSFWLIMERAGERSSFLPMFVRRLAVLAIFGGINFIFLYWGDILITYAALGALLPLAARLPQRAVLVMSALLLLGFPAAIAAMGGASGPDAQASSDVQALQAFGSQSYFVAAEYGARRYLGLAESHSVTADWNFTNIFGLFLLGLWVGRKRIPHDLSAHRAWLWKVAAVALPAGLAASLADALLPQASPFSTLMLAGRPILAIGYLAAGALLLDAPAGRPIRNLLAPAGRMALTNYLAYGLLGQILFYGWAFDLIGTVGTAEVLVASVAIYGALLAASHIWLRFFRFGPVEWMWRSCTRMSIQPLRRGRHRS